MGAGLEVGILCDPPEALAQPEGDPLKIGVAQPPLGRLTRSRQKVGRSGVVRHAFYLVETDATVVAWEPRPCFHVVFGRAFASLSLQGMALLADAFKSDMSKWPTTAPDGCELVPDGRPTAPPEPVTWAELMQISETVQDWIAEGLAAGERACVRATHALLSTQACVERYPAHPEVVYRGAGNGVALELPANWYADQGVAEGAMFDIRTVAHGSSPYFWTSALDHPVRSVEVRDSSGAPLLTSRAPGTGPELLITLTSAACAPGVARRCAFFDTGASDEWMGTGLETVAATDANITCRSHHLTDFLVFSPLPTSPSPSPSPLPVVEPSPSPEPRGWWLPRVWVTLVICWGTYVLLQIVARWREAVSSRLREPPRMGRLKSLVARHVLFGIPLPPTALGHAQRAAVFFSSFMAVLALCAAAGAAVSLFWVWEGLIAGAVVCPVELALSTLFLITAGPGQRRCVAPVPPRPLLCALLSPRPRSRDRSSSSAPHVPACAPCVRPGYPFGAPVFLFACACVRVCVCVCVCVCTRHPHGWRRTLCARCTR